MKKIGILTVLVICIVLISVIFYASFFQKKDSEITKDTAYVYYADEANATAESVSSLVSSLNEFSFDFYQTILKNNDKNIFFSPYSIFVALSMAYEGARGNTATEMHKVLNILQNDSPTLGSFGKLYNLLNQKKDGYTISTANAFWANINHVFLENYLKLLENFYMAEANTLDFSDNEQAAETINAWIEKNTNNKIKDMIQPDMLSDMTRLVLTNAIYFKGLWEKQFDPESTYKADFYLSPGETVKVDMMVSDSKDSSFNYTQTEDLQILKLNYQGNELSMMIVLPKENDISIAESAINMENLTKWRKEFTETKISVQLPRFKYEAKYTLNDILMDMGMIDAFTHDADFSGMDGAFDLFISKVLHQAYIEVNEEGTEAAAATAVIIELTAIPDFFSADHPFIYLIQHEETGAVLFIGEVLDPSQ